MTALAFAVLIACLFGLMLMWESPAGGRAGLRQTGLARWLVGGNWPAKVGAGLMLLGTGALLRYALLNLSAPPLTKLAGGLVLAVALAAAAFALRAAPRHRALHVALVGAALGVCYLTAYSAYGFFGYVTSVQALALLAVTAAAAAAFAVGSNAQSVAVLAMTGAYLAPAFALAQPGVVAVHGWYVAAALVTAAMVALRGWRALAQLSFVFTLAGALFFGWTRGFYRPEYYPLMQPMLLALVAIHLAMPLLEQRAVAQRWLLHADRAGFVLLPLVASLLTLAIAPRVDVEGALGLALLSALWSAAALLTRARPGATAAAHFGVAALLLLAAGLTALHDVPWLLLLLAAAVTWLALLPRLGQTHRAALAALLVGVLGALHIVDVALASPATAAFLHAGFAERLAGAALLIAAAWRARQLAQPAAALAAMGVAALLIALATELAKLQLPLLPYWTLAAALLLQAAAAAYIARCGARTATVALAAAPVLAASLWAALLPTALTLPALAATIVGAELLAAAAVRSARSTEAGRALALALVVASVLPWWPTPLDRLGLDADLLRLAFALAAALALAIGRLLPAYSGSWHANAMPLIAALAALMLAALTTVHITRDALAVATELAALAVLWLAGRPAPLTPERARGVPQAFAFASLIGALLIVQAMFLRAFGPPAQVLTLADLAQMRLPAVLSLTWALAGAALAAWASRTRSRGLWAVGAVLLVLAALKMVLLDFDGLTQLGNIVAVIAAGAVFLGVAWLAPMPGRPAPVDDVERDAARDEFARNARSAD